MGLAFLVARAWQKKWLFSGLFLLTFAGSVYGLARLDLLPTPPKAGGDNLAQTSTSTDSTMADETEFPVKIEIPKISLHASISNPATTDNEILDQALLSGAVRYPTSALLGQNGNVLLFGHSSYLPIVRNLAYKTFDGIQKLKAGDLIMVYSSDRVYTYRVKGVTMIKADAAAILISVPDRELTLSTCNSFGTKSDRFVVTATFVESHPASS